MRTASSSADFEKGMADPSWRTTGTRACSATQRMSPAPLA
jgi:hypothetical protein